MFVIGSLDLIFAWASCYIRANGKPGTKNKREDLLTKNSKAQFYGLPWIACCNRICPTTSPYSTHSQMLLSLWECNQNLKNWKLL